MVARRDIPVAAAAVLMLLSGWLTVVNLLDEVVLHRQMKLCDGTLYGEVQPPPRAPLDWADLWDDSVQHDFALAVGRMYPYFALAVRLRSQVEYTLFDSSAVPNVIVGRGGELLQAPYVVDYCGRDLAAFEREAPGDAAAIKSMQDAVERHGQKFLYMLTPSKVAEYPQYLPRWLPCASTAADRAGVVPAWLSLLRQDGVHVVDAQGVISRARGRYPFALFALGGTHWNQVGAALAAQALADGIDAQYGSPVVPRFTFAWRMSERPYGEDVDLLHLLNLYWRPNYAVPTVQFSQPVSGACRKPLVVVAGGSFTEEVGLHFSTLPCGPAMVEYFYWSTWRMVWVEGTEIRKVVDPARRAEEMRRADVIVYEENEELLGRQWHGTLVENWVKKDY